ncbi:MAG: extracellular solute-binding protein [Solirubrobacterales bacterium]
MWDNEYETIPQWTKATKKVYEEFEKLHPGVKVNIVAQPYEGWEAVYRAAFTAHEGPDVMLLQPGASGILSFAQGLEPVNEYLTPDLEEHVTQWDAVTPGLTEEEGTRYGVPCTVQGWVFYYNKKMFAEAGLPTKFEPKTWAEIREAGEKLKAAGIQPFTGGNKEGFENSWWFSVGFQTENEPQQAQELAEGKIDWTDEAVTKAFKPNIEMQEAGLYPSDRFSTPLFAQGYPRFAEGKGAMILGFMETIGYWQEFVPALGEKNVGIFFPPGKHPVATLGNVTWGIPKFAKNKEAAWALLEYMVSKPGMELFAEYGYLPNRDDVTLPAKFPAQAHEIEEATKSPERIVAPFLSATSAVIWQAVPRELNQVLQGRTSLEDAQAGLQEAAEKSGT